MSIESKTFKMSLDVSNLIANYKRALQAMSDVGGPERSLATFRNSLRDIENEFGRLQTMGREGISKDPKAVDNYTKSVNKAYQKLHQLGDEMHKLSSTSNDFNINAVRNLEREINTLTRQTQQFQTTFSQGLRDTLGIDRNTANTIAEQVRTQDQLIQRLEQEQQQRQTALNLAREQERVERDRRRAVAAGRIGTSIGGVSPASFGLTTQAARRIEANFAESNTSVSGQNMVSFLQRLNTMLSEGIRNSQNFNTVWQEVMSTLRDATIQNNNGMYTMLDDDRIFASLETAKNRIRAVYQEMEDAENIHSARPSRTLLQVNQAEQNIYRINEVLNQARAGESNLNEMLQNLIQTENNLANAQSRRRAAEIQDQQTRAGMTNRTRELVSQTDQLTQSTQENTRIMQQNARQIKQSENAISKFAHMVGSMFSLYTIFAAIRSEIRKTYEDIKTLDKSFASIAMVTDKSVSGMWSTYEQYANMASELGQKTNSVIEASALFYQQGLDTNEALSLTTDTMKLATLAGEDYKTATEEMTAAIRGFKMEMTEGAHVTDVYSTLAASAAASVNGIASAMSRTASIVSSAGASFENTAAFLTKMIETTQESAENIGTSLKTITARITEMKKNISGTSESEFEDLDVNKVETALKSIGVQLRDATGQIRDFDDIIVDLGEKWSGLSRNTQRYVATITAGSRQQSRLIALLDDFDRTKELMDIAADSAGKADEQFAKYADTMEYRLNQLATEWESLKTKIIQEDIFKNSIDNLTSFIEKLRKLDLEDPFDLTRVATTVGAIIAGITKTIALSKAMFQGIAGSQVEIKNAMPNAIATIAGESYKRKHPIAQVELEATYNPEDLRRKYEALSNRLQYLQNGRPAIVQMLPQISEIDAKMANANIDFGKIEGAKTRQLRSVFNRQLSLNGFNQTEMETIWQRMIAIRSEEQTLNNHTITLSESLRRVQQEAQGTVESFNQQSEGLRAVDQEIQRVQNSLNSYSTQIENNNQKIENNRLKTEQQSQAYRLQQQEIDKLTQKYKNFVSGGVSLLSTSLSTLLMYLPMAINGYMNFGDAVKMAGMQVAILTAQQALNKVSSAVSIALTSTDVVVQEARTAAYQKGTIATLKFVAAQVAANAATSLWILGIGAAIALIWAAVKAYEKWVDEQNEAKKAAEQLAEAEKNLKDIQEKRIKARADENTSKKELKDTEDLKKKWIELSAVKVKTTEQQEEEKEIIEKIKTDFPELINFYDEVNNKLDVSISKWEEILKKQKESHEEQARGSYAVAVSENYAEARVAYAENQLKQIEHDTNETAYNNMLNSLESIRKIARYSYSDALKNDETRNSATNLLIADQYLSIEQVEALNLRSIEGWKEFLKEEELSQDTILAYMKASNVVVEDYAAEQIKLNEEREQIQKDLVEAQKQDLDTYLDSIEETSVNAKVARKIFENRNSKEDYEIKEEDFYSYFQREYKPSFTTEDETGLPILVSNQVYSGLSMKGRNLLNKAGIQNSEDYEKLDTKDLTAILLGGIQAEAVGEIVKEIEGKIGEKEVEIIEEIINGSSNYTKEEIEKKRDQYKNSSNELGQAIADTLQDALNNTFNEVEKSLENFYGNKNFTGKYSDLKALEATTQNFIDQNSREGQDAAGFVRYMGNLFSQQNIPLEKLGSFLQSNIFANYNPLDKAGFEENFQELIEETFSGVKLDASLDKITDDIKSKLKNKNILDDTINLEVIKTYAKKAKSILDIFADKGGSVQKYLNLNKDFVEITDATELKKLQEIEDKFIEAGVAGAKEILRTDEQTQNTILDTAKLRQIQNQYGKDAIKTLREQINEHEKIIIAYEGALANDREITKKEEEQYDLAKAMIDPERELLEGLIDAEKYSKAVTDNFHSAAGQLSAMANISSSFSSTLNNFQKNKILKQSDIKSLQDAFGAYGIDANQFINGTLGLNNPETFYKSALTQLQKSLHSAWIAGDQNAAMQARGYIAELYDAWMTYLENIEDEKDKQAENEKKREEELLKVQEKVKEAEEKVNDKRKQNEEDEKEALEDLKKAEEDIEKAREAYVEQLGTIEEKQRAINDAIEKYNELLYGTANRKSGLDLLYNYEEALSSLNDELSRSEDKLSMSENIDDAVNALTRYTQATHNLIATEKAKQVAIKAGLSNYSNMIENGTASYTNRETGEVIGINFGDYAKKDTATGKYILNQQLLNQASFNDEYKNLIENNIETYNKYLDDYNKIEDEILKKEKELQDKRKQSLKKYGDFEKGIADALKAQYEKEVNNLKDKYNAMKDADEDYLSALEDAINKQKELRDREDKYEELAEKEKRLSLLQRDTSGSRLLDVNKLKKDLEKTRRSLLDDAVNDVVEGMKKLAKENEETRQVEMQLKDAIIANTAHWNMEAQTVAASFNNADEYASYMVGLNPDFLNLTVAQQENQINEYKEQFAQALEYQSWNLIDTTSQSGDAIIDIVNVSTEQILEIVSEKTSAFSEEVIRAYNEVSEKVTKDLETQEEAIDDARDALQDAIDKLGELSEDIDEAIQKLEDLKVKQADEAAERQKDLDKLIKEWQEAITEKYETETEIAKEIKKEVDSIHVPDESIYNTNPGGITDNSNITETTAENTPNNKAYYTGHAQGMEGKTYEEIIENLNKAIQAEANTVRFSPYSNEPANEGRFEAIKNQIDELFSVLSISNVGNSYKDKYEAIGRELDLPVTTYKLDRYAKGGLVDFTGPAWVDGTPSAPEAFLSAADTRAIGDAVKILSDLQILKDYDNLGQSINNTIGDTSIEINLNIENISSEIDIDNMLNRVKDEIVSVANPIGINTILKQR